MARKAKKTAKKKSAKSKRSSPTRLQKMAAEIDQCRDSDGKVRPRKYLSMTEQHPEWESYKEFEWDDAKAALRDRLRTAAELIRRIPVIVEYGEIKIVAPAWVSERGIKGESSYSKTIAIAKSPIRAKKALQDEINRIKAQIHRALKLSVVFNLRPAFERMLEDVVRIETELGDDDL